MFTTELNFEEECLLEQILNGENLNRVMVLNRINSICGNTESHEEGINTAKTLFEKIKSTSDYEYQEYIKIINSNH